MRSTSYTLLNYLRLFVFWMMTIIGGWFIHPPNMSFLCLHILPSCASCSPKLSLKMLLSCIFSACVCSYNDRSKIVLSVVFIVCVKKNNFDSIQVRLACEYGFVRGHSMLFIYFYAPHGCLMEYVMECVMGCLMVSKYGVTAGCILSKPCSCTTAKDTTISPSPPHTHCHNRMCCPAVTWGLLSIYSPTTTMGFVVLQWYGACLSIPPLSQSNVLSCSDLELSYLLAR